MRGLVKIKDDEWFDSGWIYDVFMEKLIAFEKLRSAPDLLEELTMDTKTGLRATSDFEWSNADRLLFTAAIVGTYEYFKTKGPESIPNPSSFDVFIESIGQLNELAIKNTNHKNS